MRDSVGQLAQHGFIEKIVFRPAEGHPRDSTVDAQLHVLKLLWLAPFRLAYEFFGVDRLNHSRSPANTLS